jgi:hypothetical protein
MKRMPSLHKHSTTLRRIAASAGLRRALDLKVARYFDFFPTPQGFRGMKDREEFGRGPNEDYLCSLFHIIQCTHNEQLVPAVRQRIEATAGPNRALVERLLRDLECGRAIDGRLSNGHYGIPFANFPAEEIERALAACAARKPLARASHG